MSRVKAFLRLVAIEHSVFALPFAYLAAVTALPRTLWCPTLTRERWSGDRGWFSYEALRDGLESGRAAAPGPSGADGVPRELVCGDQGLRVVGVLLLVTVAMVAARTFAMAANRVIDRHVDARNPRTASRELVTGAVSVRTAWAGAVVALVVFLAAAAALGPLPLLLAPLAVVPLVVYPYAKRFTDFPHAVLGLAQAVAPVGAWIAVANEWSWSAVVLGLAVGTWIGGFDLIYACQDTESDRANGVRSTPARFGNAAALRASSAAHVLTFALFVWFGLLEGFGWLWYAGLAVTAVAFVYQHRIVTPDDLSRANRAFFTANGFVGLALGATGVLDVVLR